MRIPGTTRDWVGEMANLDGLAVMLMDTPGVRSTSDAIEAIAIEYAGQEVERADLVVILLDATQSLGPDERELLDRYPQAMRVMNKSDLPSAGDWQSESFLAISAKTGWGCAMLIDRIKQHFQVGVHLETARWWNAEQRARLIVTSTKINC